MKILVAVPTYQRPVLLRRALASLQEQSWQQWEAYVFDDSPSGEGADVVKGMDDERIHYAKNPGRLGAAANIDLCFGERLRGHDGCGFVLEDDNFLLPSFFERASMVMESTGATLALFNQRIAQPSGELAPESRTTRGAWFRDGWVECRELHASLLLMEGLSNGGIVWRIGADVQLAVGASVKFTALHEACRSLLVRDRFWFNQSAFAVWMDFPHSESARLVEKNQLITRGTQAITRFVLARYGQAAVDLATVVARANSATTQLVRRLLHVGALRYALAVDPREAVRSLAFLPKGIASLLIRPNPCHEYLARLARDWKADCR